ncbi:hypothetical protein STEG23_027768 [Scotinomys teguina]
MEVVVAAPRCQLLLILLMSAVMLLPGTNGSLLLVQRTVTRTIVLQETIGKKDPGSVPRTHMVVHNIQGTQHCLLIATGFPTMILMHLLIDSLFSVFNWTPGALPGPWL